jgi:lipopolysaccharide biosynthesis regulator YciM
MADDLETLADPTNPNDAERLARERLAEGDVDGAERVVRFALDFNPADVRLLSVTGDIAARRGDYPAAIKWVEKAIDAKPGYFHARNQLVHLRCAGRSTSRRRIPACCGA